MKAGLKEKQRERVGGVGGGIERERDRVRRG